MKPLITVVTPSYNNNSTIYSTIKSVLSQTYPQIQYIISDDCTEDFDCDEIRQFVERHNSGNIVDLLVVKNPQNYGTSKNLNSALSYAKGEYLFNIAADDMFRDERVLEEWVEQFLTSGAQVITAARAVYDDKLVRELYVSPSKSEVKILKRSTPSELFDKMSTSNMIFGCCTARTKANYELLGGYDEQYRLIEDYPSNMKLLRQNIEILYWDRIVINYRSGGISSCGNISNNYLEESDKIFNQEILPYVSNKRRAQKKYAKWKKETKIIADRFRIGEKLKKDNSVLNKLLYYLVTTIKNPCFSLKALKNKLSRR